MEATLKSLTHPSEPSEPPAAGGAAASPRWVMLNQYGDASSVTDANTSVISCTSTGWLFRISFLLAPPPANSTFSCNWVGDVPKQEERYHNYSNINVPDINIVTAHDNSVVFQMRIPDEGRSASKTADVFEYFLYDGGGGAAGARPPSLFLLPRCAMSYLCQRERDAGCEDSTTTNALESCARGLFKEHTGVLRRGDDVVMVAQLELAPWRAASRDTAELCVLRFPGCDWDLKRLPIVHHDGTSKVDAIMAPWVNDAVVPIGDRFMCWVDFLGGILLCDMADQITKLTYVPLPMDSAEHSLRISYDRPNMQISRALTGAGAGMLRFVSVDRRCCCGGFGESDCARSRFAFMVITWTMSLLKTTGLSWVKNGVFDCDELWALPNSGSLPRMPLEHPVVSSDDPDVVCFLLSNDYRGGSNLKSYEDARSYTVLVNTRCKTLLSILPHDTIVWGGTHVPAKLNIH